MRPVVLALALALLCGPAQADDQAELAARKAKKLAGKWLTKAPWVLDYDAARRQARERGTVIYAYFTRSFAP